MDLSGQGKVAVPIPGGDIAKAGIVQPRDLPGRMAVEDHDGFTKKNGFHHSVGDPNACGASALPQRKNRTLEMFTGQRIKRGEGASMSRISGSGIRARPMAMR